MTTGDDALPRAGSVATTTSSGSDHGDAAEGLPRTCWATAWDALGTAVSGFLGLLPHVLHHVGLFAGAFLVTGATGNLLFGLAGLVLSVPLLRRLYRRHRSWKAPAIAVAVFAAVFSLSAFVIGPAVTGGSEPSPTQPIRQPAPDEHAQHHGG